MTLALAAEERDALKLIVASAIDDKWPSQAELDEARRERDDARTEYSKLFATAYDAERKALALLQGSHDMGQDGAAAACQPHKLEVGGSSPPPVPTYWSRHPGDAMIIRNRARCRKCGAEMESTRRHDFVACACGNFVDGGHEYIRRGGNMAEIEELSEYGEDDANCKKCGAPFNNANPTPSGLCAACAA